MSTREEANKVLENLKAAGIKDKINQTRLSSEIMNVTGHIHKGYITTFIKSMVAVGALKPSDRLGEFIILKGEV